MRTLAAVLAALTLALDASEPKPLLVDGSSTVYPISVATAERFAQERPEIKVEVKVSGSTAGIRRLVAREIPVADASRCVNQAERDQLAAKKIDVLELPIGFDGISVAVNAQNTWATSLTLDELKRLWSPGSTVKRWSDLRPEWPAKPIALFAPGKDSGTFDYFTTEIIGTARAMRDDATTSQNAMDLVQGIVGDPYAIGYFGYAYVVENRAMLKPLAIDAGSGPIEPTRDNILSGSYRLARPLFIYVDRAALDARGEVREFVEFYLGHARETVESLGGVPLTEALDAAVRKRYADRVVGSLFADAAKGARLDQLLLGAPAMQPAAKAEPTAKSEPVAKVQPALKPDPPPSAARRVGALPSGERLEALRDQALTVARLVLDDEAPVDDLVRAERELRARLDEITTARVPADAVGAR